MARFVMPLQSAFGQRVVPFDGAKLFFFAAGTSTPKDTFSDPALTTPNTNPVIANADGRFPEIFLSGDYKVQLKDKNDVQEWESDNIEGGGTDAIQLFDQNITEDFTIPTGKNGLAVNPTIDSGVTVTVASGSEFVIVG